MITTKDFGALAGVAEPEAAVDPNAPVELPRRCGLCAHFRRFFAGEHPRVVRFGTCALAASKGAGRGGHDLMPVDTPTSIEVGDLFGCVFFLAKVP